MSTQGKIFLNMNLTTTVELNVFYENEINFKKLTDQME